MSTFRSKLRYLVRSVTKQLSGFVSSCPNCGSQARTTIDAKFGVTKLVECGDCFLLYRIPVDSAYENARFYESEYDEGGTTTLPTDEELTRLLEGRSTGIPNDYNSYISLLDCLNVPRGSRVLDYGCSWGYGALQIRKVGMQVEGYEPSEVRARYAKESLDLAVTSDRNDLRPNLDVFFSSHVLEHVANLQETFALARGLTKPGGIFLSVTPNGSPEFRQNNWLAFHRLWGLSHPQLLQARFVRKAFAGRPLLIASAPYSLDFISKWNREDSVECDLKGWELLIITIL